MNYLASQIFHLKFAALVILGLLPLSYFPQGGPGVAEALPQTKHVTGKPNILWICADQQRWNTINALGNEYVRTPNLDRLVKEGTAFNYAHCTAPICTPSRASFLTGMYSSTLHATKNGAAYWPETAPLVTKMLKDAGYDCGLAGKFHLSSAQVNNPEKRPEDDGYRMFSYSHSPHQGGDQNQYLVWLKKQGYEFEDLKKLPGEKQAALDQTTWCTNEAIDFIEQDRREPWLMSLNIYAPHGPNDPPAHILERFDVESLPGPVFRESDLEQKSVFNDVMFQSKPRHPDSINARLRQARYWAEIELIDENIGRLLETLEKTGQLGNTLIIFTSDHGDMLGDHGLVNKGCRFYEGLVRVPLIFWWPGQLKQNQQSDALVSLIDIAPTLLEIAGEEVPEHMQGRSLLPILKGEANPDHFREFVRCEFYSTIGDVKGRKASYATMIRTKEYKLVNYHGHSSGELFDLGKDPDEFENRWDDPDYQKIKMELMKKSFDETVFAIDTGPEKIGRY
ncbi:arylsulfatase A-like enzyme [Anseongella ginsenosidimutans]|uniref:Arylsulfatase A-like enzyme n=1 Tax=Anseongella ginsenosidimutans TaxID=496056 RepID=A0A4R3KP13_9SPHI|nr:sulfatase-like hydrolase/transferase [Anseongella ginsenosidimutans]QEC52399.1 sulfatase-like hydrolase/transferase [Anseongella ginsenosidimutans]TCS85858.1 arylsulfatase A-like enzyme [Anseongella ginsenosidimutans]